MYAAILIVLIAAAIGLVVLGVRRRSPAIGIAGAAVGVGTTLLFGTLKFWGEMLWFDSLGFSGPFWTAALSKIGFAAAGAVLGGALVWLLTRSMRRTHRLIRWGVVGISAYSGGQWGVSNWQTLLMYFHRVTTGTLDPIFGRDVGFYLFVLPFYDSVQSLVLLLAVLAAIALLVSLFVHIRGGELTLGLPDERGPRNGLYVAGGVALAALAWGTYLDRYYLMYSQWGAVFGAGWTDVYVRLPAYWVTLTITAAVAVVLAVPPLRRRWVQGRIERKLARANVPRPVAHPLTLAAAVAVLLATWTVALGIVPALVQWLRVEPNEITYEKPFIANNIEYTRKAFALDRVEEEEFPAVERFTRRTVSENRNLFDNIRLWDWRALDAVYKQFQEIRLYYEFADVDIDRYTIDGRYRQVMVSARELNLDNLPAQSQTFVNRHFKYTHGYGITLSMVSDFTSEGLPNLLIRDIPPQSAYASLEVDRPEIYYGELTEAYAIVNTAEKEFDYPRGGKNVYARYAGDGGVDIGSLWRRFVYGWSYGGTRLLLSGYPTADSRIMIHRDIRRRVRKLAPFLRFDNDPYVVLVGGRLKWIIDAYTTSTDYPYSEPFSGREVVEARNGRTGRVAATDIPDQFRDANYVRNSVKAVIDAYDGSVTFYVMDDTDPLIRVWRNIFPDLFTPREQMPDELFDHVRYPADLLLVQGLVYAKYHMTDPTVFYNQEDLWVRATEKYYQQVQAVQPYYIMWEPPGSDRLEYVLMLPFTPKNRQVLIGWIAGMCDRENYGRFLAYKFPKDKRLIGPQQVETKIDQDANLSERLTLWDQRGSSVIRGNVLAIPVAGTLLYVEPIYLQADTAAYPELRLVVVMHGDTFSYAESFEEALGGLYGEGPATRPSPTTTTQPGAPRPPGPPGEYNELIRQAGDAYEDWLRLTGEKRFDEAADALDRLGKALETLQRKSGANQPADGGAADGS